MVGILTWLITEQPGTGFVSLIQHFNGKYVYEHDDPAAQTVFHSLSAAYSAYCLSQGTEINNGISKQLTHTQIDKSFGCIVWVSLSMQTERVYFSFVSHLIIIVVVGRHTNTSNNLLHFFFSTAGALFSAKLQRCRLYHIAPRNCNKKSSKQEYYVMRLKLDHKSKDLFPVCEA